MRHRIRSRIQSPIQFQGSRARAGFTLLEVTIVATLLVVVLLGALTVLRRDAQLSESVLRISNVELMSQEMLFDLERELSDADGAEPLGVLGASLSASETTRLEVGSTVGFPDEGLLIVARGTNDEERIRYSSFEADQETFLSLERGQQGTTPQSHVAQTELMWGGLAVPLEEQEPASDDLWDGRALVAGTPVFFRGDGTGFSYRKPVDPTGANDFVIEDDIQWGAEIHGEQNTSFWSCITFVERYVVTEAEAKRDLNGDGDEDDTFDVGQLRRRTWDSSDPDRAAQEVGLGPAAVMQERNDWGSDLDGDGFEDPLLLWEPSTRQVHLTLFLLGQNQGITTVRRVSSTVFLRNQLQS